jgi:hypothetical protein
MAAFAWDFQKLVNVYAGQVISGFSGKVMIEPNGGEPIATKTTGSDGKETIVVFHNNTSGKVTYSLMASSASNDVLDALATQKTIGPLLIRDTNGRTVLDTPSAWVAERPPVGFGAELDEREWVLEYADGNLVIGGLTQA